MPSSISTICFDAEFLKSNGFPVFAVHTVKPNGSCSCDKKDCCNIAKHPATFHGFKDACDDSTNTEGGGISADSNLNIGIATGRHFFVLDVDKKNGGLETLAEFEKKYGKLPATISCETGGGGRHLYFKKEPKFKIKCFQNPHTGLEIKGEGGYVVCPPSIHASGKSYEWIVPPYEEMAEAPQWLLDYINTNANNKKTVQVKSQDQPPQSSINLDLKNHFGTEEGSRNNTLCQLIGREFGKKTPPDEILKDAYDWGERCTPPMEKVEIERTFKSILHRENSKHAVPLIQKKIPVLGEDAYYGIAGDVVKKIAPETEGHPFGLLICLLTYIGNLIDRKCYFTIGGTKHFPNLFSLLVGDSSKARKGTALDRILQIFENQISLATNIATGLSSGEGIKESVKDDVIESKADKNNPNLIIQSIKEKGVDDKRILIIETEFAQTLTLMKREGNTLSPVLRDAFDSKVLQSMTRNSPTKATGAHISIIGNITIEELLKLLDKTSMLNGFGNRFLFGFVKRTKLLPHGGEKIDFSDFNAKLLKNIQGLQGEMQWTPEAKKLWEEIYLILAAEKEGLVGDLTNRIEVHTLRISMIYAIIDGSLCINVQHLKAAYAIILYSLQSVELIFGNKPNGSTLELRLFDIIQNNNGIKLGDIHKALGGHTTAKLIQDALTILESQSLIYCEKQKSNGGRDALVWFSTYLDGF